MFRQVVAFCAVVAVVYGAVAIHPLEEKPKQYKDVEGCYISDLDTVIPVGQAEPSCDKCEQYRCSEEYYTIETCGAVAAPDCCTPVEDLEEAYPACCKKFDCSSCPNNDE